MYSLRRMRCVLLAMLAFLCIGPALAQYPDKPIRLVVPYPPGGGADTMARAVVPKLAEALNATIVIDNRGGASGNIGTEAVARSSPDGYTLAFIANVQTSINPSLYGAKLGFDPERDITPVGMVGRFYFLLVAHADLQVKDLKSLLDLDRKQSPRLHHGTSGNGSPQHLAGAMFNRTTGANLVHVPYRGTGPAMADLLSGQTQVMFATIPVVEQHVRAGKLKPIAVTSLKRAKQFPDTPTLDESGLRGFDVDAWYAIYAPAGTPRPVIDKLSAALAKTMADPAMAARLNEQGIEPYFLSPEMTAKVARTDREKWAKVVAEAGVKID